jgi:hypothetical protein
MMMRHIGLVAFVVVDEVGVVSECCCSSMSYSGCKYSTLHAMPHYAKMNYPPKKWYKVKFAPKNSKFSRCRCRAHVLARPDQTPSRAGRTRL